MEILKDIDFFVSLASNSVTLILGTISLFMLVKHRDRVRAFANLISNTFLNERLKGIKGALARLDSLNYENKEDRREISALCGEIAGMVKYFVARDSSYAECYENFTEIAQATRRLTEPRKRQLSQELHSLLDDSAMVASIDLLKKEDGC